MKEKILESLIDQINHELTNRMNRGFYALRSSLEAKANDQNPETANVVDKMQEAVQEMMNKVLLVIGTCFFIILGFLLMLWQGQRGIEREIKLRTTSAEHVEYILLGVKHKEVCSHETQ